MQSEFYNVALDRIRYSLVWEDSQTLYNALDINENDHLLIITSAGCNVLNALLRNPASVTAIDLNPVQNKLLLLKKHIILHHDFDVYQSLSGFNGKNAVSHAKQELFETLPVDERNYWIGFFNDHPDGLLTSGKLESYITAFYKTLHRVEQQNLHKLITFENIKEQYDFFKKYLHKSCFKQLFINYFNDENLSKGRDTELLKYASETGGEAFYNRLVQQVRSTLINNNFYFRFFFFGPLDLPENILPPCYRKENYHALKSQLSRLQIITGEAIDYLLSPSGTTVNKASLSNIFEYISRQEFKNVCHALSQNADRNLRIVFWNLLNTQGDNISSQINLNVEEIKPSEKSCFYFKNVLALQYAPVSSPKPVYSV